MPRRMHHGKRCKQLCLILMHSEVSFFPPTLSIISSTPPLHTQMFVCFCFFLGNIDIKSCIVCNQGFFFRLFFFSFFCLICFFREQRRKRVKRDWGREELWRQRHSFFLSSKTMQCFSLFSLLSPYLL